MDWTTIVAIAFGVLLPSVVGFIGWRWVAAKRLLREVAEALTVVSTAVEDDQLTDEEVKAILAEWKDVIEAAKKVIWG